MSAKNRQIPTRYETLEPRRLLAFDATIWSAAISQDHFGPLTSQNLDGSKIDPAAVPAIEATHHYSSDGKPHGMVILADRIAIQRSSTAATRDVQLSLTDANLQLQRPLDGSFSVYTATAEINANFLESLIDSGWASEIVPVFGLVESRSEAVLLDEAIISIGGQVSADDFFSSESAIFAKYRRLDGSPDQFVATLRTAPGVDTLQAINRFEQDSRLEWIAPNFHQNWQRFLIPNDPRFGNLWHLHNVGQGGGLVDADPNLPEAWDIIAGGLESIVVGIVDDGVAIDHPDLFNWVNVGEVAGDDIDNDGNGWVDDIFGWNFVDDNNTSEPNSVQDNHGTAVAGVAAARGNNGIGVTGAAYNSPVISARIFRGNAVANDAGIASSIYYTSGRTQDGTGTWDAAHIVNHSWGGGGQSNAIIQALQWATTEGRNGLGVPQVFASGNGFGPVSFPARLSAVNPGVIAVGAMNNFGEKSNYSSFGSQLDIVAPSNDTRPGFLAIDTTDRIGAPGYAAGDYTGTGGTGFGGTSSAAPLATGIGALALARAEQIGVDLTAADLKLIMRNNTKLAGSTNYNLNSGRNDLMGYGLINAESLVQGIGRAQISVTTENEVVTSASEFDLGTVLMGQSGELRLRLRNQGTETLVLSDWVASIPDFTVTGLGQSSLDVGESTTFTVRFDPVSGGLKSGVISLFSNDDLTPEFTFKVTGTSIPVMISGKVFEDRDGDQELHANETGLAGRKVFLDSNGDGIHNSSTDSLFVENSEPIRIYDHQTTSMKLLVEGMVDTINKINVVVDITHNYVSDLEIVLVSPNGTRVVLFNNVGGGGNNLVNTVFDDSASLPIADGTAPYSGFFQPAESLSMFNNVDANGVWTLEVTDSVAGDQGWLNRFAIEINNGEFFTLTDRNGNYVFGEIPTGEYSAIVEHPVGWTPSGETVVPFVVENSETRHSGINFGAGKNDRFYGLVYHDLNNNGIVDENENGLSERVVILDNDLDGQPDRLRIDYANFDQVPIIDLQTVESVTEVSGVAGQLIDLEVTLNIAHTWVSDLIITLEGPDGTSITLVDQAGGPGVNFTDTVLSDSGDDEIANGEAPFTGRFRPEEPLSTFLDLNPNGLWRLQIQDTFQLDQGTLLNWKLHFFVDAIFETGIDGWFFYDLDPGDSNLLLVDRDNWMHTQPVDGLIVVTANNTPFYNQLYGSREMVTTIMGSHVYYPNSNFFANGGLEAATDLGKVLARESGDAQTLSFDNLINVVGGIQGMYFEIDFLPSSELTVDDFVFQVSPTGAFIEADHPPANWEMAAAPLSIESTVDGLSTRVAIEWAADAISNRWLRVSLQANANTGLAAAESWYLGHLMGETNGMLSNGVYRVTIADALGIIDRIGQTVDASDVHDLNKDGFVTNADVILMLSEIGGNNLRNITVPGVGGGSAGIGLMFSGGNGNNSNDGKKSSKNEATSSIEQLRLLPRDQAYSKVSISEPEARKFPQPHDQPTLRTNLERPITINQLPVSHSFSETSKPLVNNVTQKKILDELFENELFESDWEAIKV